MSQVTEQSVRFQTALASIKLIQASAVLDLTEDDFDFLTSKDRKSGSAGMPRPISYAVFCLKKKKFMGVQPPSYPVNLIHLFTSGQGEAIIQVSIKQNTPCRED